MEMKHLRSFLGKLMLVVAAMLCTTQMFAANVECYSRGVAHCILNDGSGNYPVVEAGEVFVSLTPDATPVWTEGTTASEVAVNIGNASAGTVKQNFYFWAKAKPGYKFIGWNTSKTGKTAAAGSETEGAPYLKTYTHWSAGSESAPKEQVMYAIFEKQVSADDEPQDLGNGVAAVRVENNEYAAGSSSKNFRVRIYFAEGLLFNGSASASQGVNPDAARYVTCKQGETSVGIVEVSTGAAWADASYTTYEPAYGTIELPHNIAPGEYDVHLPYSLFKTATGGVTAPYDFKVVVYADNEPLTILSTSPKEGYKWDADPESETTDGESLMVSITFDKYVDHVTADKAVLDNVLLKSGTGKTILPESITVSKLNNKIGLISYGKLPNGDYTFTLPEGVFVAANGLSHSAKTVNFSITGSKVDEWALPTYTTVSSTPQNNAAVRSLTKVEIEFAREGYDDPVGIMPGSNAVTATKVISWFDPENNDPEYVGDQRSENIENINVAVKAGKLVVTFAEPVAEECKVVINVPAGIINNLAMPVATMTKQEIYEAGGCTNAALSLNLNIEPKLIKVQDVTGIGFNSTYLTDEEGNFVKDENGEYIRVDEYKSLIDAQLVPPVNNGDGGDRITYMYFWYPEEFAALNYKGGASVVNITNGIEYEIAAIEFKTGGDHYRKNVIQLRLSSTNYIHSDRYDQGVYEVTLPDSAAITADGMFAQGIKFQFTYGDPSKAYFPDELDLDDYLGDYVMVKEEGEDVETTEAFTLAKTTEGKYVVENLCGSSLTIPVEASTGGSFVLKFTENTAGDAFMSTSGGDVVASAALNDGKHYIYIDEFALYFADGSYVPGGIRYYELLSETAIDKVKADASSSAIYNLLGQRIRTAKGIVIKDGKKYLVK